MPSQMTTDRQTESALNKHHEKQQTNRLQDISVSNDSTSLDGGLSRHINLPMNLPKQNDRSMLTQSVQYQRTNAITD